MSAAIAKSGVMGCPFLLLDMAITFCQGWKRGVSGYFESVTLFFDLLDVKHFIVGGGLSLTI